MHRGIDLDKTPLWQAAVYYEHRETAVETDKRVVRDGVLEAIDNIQFK